MLKRISWRNALALAILILTAALFINFFATHASVRHKLGQVSLPVLAGLLILYFGFVASLSLINKATVRLCKTHITSAESLTLTMYSSIINFFAPLQSGPAFRALYLKNKHGLKLREYTRASLVYYFFYALFSGLLLLSGVLKWWLPAAIGLCLAVVWIVNRTKIKGSRYFKKLALTKWYYMALATAIQITFIAVIYYIELKTVAPHVSISQALVYTGAANFSLFVALTPGAIGFRESFLLFSQRLHHIDNSTIVAANAIDRAVYIVLLGILAVIIFATHARSRLLSAAPKD